MKRGINPEMTENVFIFRQSQNEEVQHFDPLQWPLADVIKRRSQYFSRELNLKQTLQIISLYWFIMQS